MPSGLVLILIGMAYLASGSRYGWERVSNPGPGFFPDVIGALFLAGSIVLCFSSFAARRAGTRPPAPHAEPHAGAQLWPLLALLAAYLLAVEWVGYLLASPPLVLFLARLMGLKRWTPAVLLALATALGSYLVFATWLQVPLPRGIWGGG
jgi:putative tricarboxylic transport membrane protein